MVSQRNRFPDICIACFFYGTGTVSLAGLTTKKGTMGKPYLKTAEFVDAYVPGPPIIEDSSSLPYIPVFVVGPALLEPLTRKMRKRHTSALVGKNCY